jgi:SAM-dependent methyltransferase
MAPGAPAVPVDYDDDPERFRAARRATARWSLAGDVHTPVAARLRAEALQPVLDVGCGDGALLDEQPPVRGWVGLDLSPAQLQVAPGPVIEADAACLPIAGGMVGAVVALWVLYHLDEPLRAVAEARRVLRPGGLFVACTTARDDSPELLRHLGAQPPSTFDAEEAPEVVGRVFESVEIERWDAPLIRLPDRAAVVEYLLGRALGRDIAEDVARRVDTPLDVTKRGVLVWGRKRR